ncbi:MAG: hypothetical protein ACI9U2_002991 [Bradymonadia bacterium]|jgi:hypothetical protein
MSVLKAVIGLFLVGVLTACGGPPPPSLTQQVAVLDAQMPAGKRGWWLYLSGDVDGARAAFEAAPEDPWAALGRARLAKDALDLRRTLGESAMATTLSAPADGTIAAIGQTWAAVAAKQLRDGDTLAQQALQTKARTRIKADRHTVRISFLSFLQMPRLHARPPVVEGERVTALSQLWALTAKRPKADPEGIILSTFSLPTGMTHLQIEVDGPAIAWRGGRVVAASPLDHHGPQTLRFSVKGEGHLVLAWAAARHPRVWRQPLGVPPSDDRLGPKVPERGPGIDWPWRYLHAELALLDGDAETAGIALRGAPKTAAFMALRARLTTISPGLPRGAARDQARAAWLKVVDLAPARAHLALARIAWRIGDVGAARPHLDAVLARAPDAFFAHQTALRLALSEGRHAAAARSLEAARRSAVSPCSLLGDQAALADARPGADAALIAAYQRCDRPLDAVDRLLGRGQPAPALGILDGLSTRAKAKVRARTLRARTLVGLGRLADAHAVYATLKDAASSLTAADLAFALDLPETQAGLARVVALHPTATPALELVVAHPELSPFASLVLDSEAAITAWQATVPQSGPAVRVLDHSASIYFKDGKSLRWVHEVLAVRSRDAAERFGEIGLPEDVRLVALYTRKFDGRRIFAEQVPEKETITLPDLETGDFVVAMYLDTGDNGYLYDSGFLTPRVFFQGTDLPAFHQRFEVYADTPPTVHRLAGAPMPTRVGLGEKHGVRMESRAVALLPPEGDAPPVPLWLPSARAGHAVVLSDDLAYLRDRVLKQRRRTPAFDAWAERSAGEGDLDARLLRLSRAVREEIDDTVGLMEADVSVAVTSGTGNRGLVMSAALEHLGVRHRLLVARARVHVPSGPFLTATDFSYPLIDLGDRVLDPGPERAAPGFFPFTLVGGDALVAWPPEAAVRPVALPGSRAVPDQRRVEVEMHWHADGKLTGTVVDRLIGQEAIVVGHHLSRLTPAQRPRLMERLLVGVVGAAKVTQFDDPTQQDPDGPLELRYQFTAQPGDALPLGLFPVQPGRSYASQAERSLPLSITLPTDQIVRLRLTSDRPFKGEPHVGKVTDGTRRYALDIEQDEDALTATARLLIPGGLVPVADYAGFKTWAHAVDEAERVRLTVRPSP